MAWKRSTVVLSSRRVTCLRVRLDLCLDEPAYIPFSFNLLLDVARSHPLQRSVCIPQIGW
jgi:hypothetical protein